MKSLQICLLSAVLVIAASNPIPADEPASTAAPVVPDVTPAVKTAAEQPVVPAVAASEVPATQKSLPIDLDKIPEPQALPSKKEEPAPVKAEEKKREVAVEQPTVKPVEAVAQPEQVTGKSLPETPAKEIVPEASAAPKVEQPQAAESVKSVDVQQPSEAAPTVPAVPAVAAAVPEAKQADVKQAIESTVVPVVPSGLASEKKIDAEAPVAIVSENVQQPAVAAVEPEQKSALPVPAEQVQAAPEQPQQPQQEVAQALAQERSAQDPAAAPIAAASTAETTAAPADTSSSGSSEKKSDSDESGSSEESKESQEEPEKKKEA